MARLWLLYFPGGYFGARVESRGGGEGGEGGGEGGEGGEEGRRGRRGSFPFSTEYMGR